MLVLSILLPSIALADSPGGVFANLSLWLKADAGTTGTASVTAWTDQSIGGSNATATTGPALVEDSINFNPALNFDGTDDV